MVTRLHANRITFGLPGETVCDPEFAVLCWRRLQAANLQSYGVTTGFMDGSTVADAPASTAPTSVTRTFFPFSWVWFSVIALAISVPAYLRIADGDIWVHLRNAKELLARGAFLHADGYTFTSSGAPLINFEWLSELPYYLAFTMWDLRGLLAVYLVLLWLIFGGVYWLAMRRGADPADAALVTMGGAFIGAFSYGPRMFQFGWLCLVALLLVLDYFERTEKGIWTLPLIFGLWINLHGSWVLGFVVLGIYIVCGLITTHSARVFADHWTPHQLRNLLVATAASIAALFVNPYGYKLVWYPFELFSRQTAVREQLTEWQSVDFHTFWGKLGMFMILGLLAAAWFSPKPWPLRDIFLATLAVWSSLTHIRFLLFAGIILVPIIAPRLQLLAYETTPKQRPWLNLVATAIIVAIIAWSYPSEAQLQKIVDTQYPRDALRFIQQKQITGRLFHYYAYGGYIEWFAPNIKTFADPRTDIFVYNGVLDDYLKINGIDESLELLDKYKVDYVLFPVGKHLNYLLDHSSTWRTIYADNVVKLYERSPGGAVVR